MTDDHDRPDHTDGTAHSPRPLASVTPLRGDDRTVEPTHPAAPPAEQPDRVGARPSTSPSTRPIAGSPVVDALELCDALAAAAGCPVTIFRNREREIEGTLLAATADEVEVPGWGNRHVVHLLVDRSWSRGPVPVMVSLLTGVDPDADFFFPVCPIRVQLPDGPIELHLR